MHKSSSILNRRMLTILASLILAFLVLVFALFDSPFGTDRFDSLSRGVMWALTILGGTVLVLGVQILIAPEMDNYIHERLIATALGLAILFPWVMGVLTVIFPKFAIDGELVVQVLLMYALIAVPSEIISYAENKIWSFTDNAPATQSEPTQTLCHLNADLPLGMQQFPIWAMRADDHYIHIITEQGTHMVLSTLSDAIAKTTAIQGVRVHRSHWVAKQGIHDITRKQGRLYATLHDGTEIPISRSGQSAIKSLGWIK